MITIKYKPNDLRYIFLISDTPKEMTDLESFLNKIPNFMWMPSFSGIPTPVVFLNKFKGESGSIIYYCHSGLWKTIYDWCQENHIQVSGIDSNFKYNDFKILMRSRNQKSLIRRSLNVTHSCKSDKCSNSDHNETNSDKNSSHFISPF